MARKYGNRHVIVDGIRFDSAKEAKRYGELKLMEKAGVISGLRLQPKFDLSVNDVSLGFYKGDFWYETPEGAVVEDVKGYRNPKDVAYRLYQLKAKLVLALYGVEITEV